MAKRTIAPVRRHPWTSAGALLAAVVIALLTVLTVGVSTAGADGTVVTGNPSCPAGTTDLRINAPATGTFSDGTLTVVVTVRTLTADDPGHGGNQTGSQVFDFTATGGSVIQVIVKGGPNANVYGSLASPFGNSGTGLHAPLGAGPGGRLFFGLSHISFCYVETQPSSTVTTPSASSITIGGSVTDTAVVTGNSIGGDPTGTVDFYICAPGELDGSGECSSGGTLVSDDVALVSDGVAGTFTSSATSASFEPTSTGTWCFRGEYGGSTVYDPSEDHATSECVTVNLAASEISTDPWIYPNDEATVEAATGQTDITGSVTFKLYDSAANCDANGATGLLFPAETVNLSATTATSKTVNTSNTTFKIEADAVVFWRVEYSGDANHSGRLSDCVEKIDVDLTGDAGPGDLVS